MSENCIYQLRKNILPQNYRSNYKTYSFSLNIETKPHFSPDQIYILFFLCLNISSCVLWKNSWVFRLHCIKVRSPGMKYFSGCMNRDKYMLLFRSVLNMKFCVISYFHAFLWRVVEKVGFGLGQANCFLSISTWICMVIVRALFPLGPSR